RITRIVHRDARTLIHCARCTVTGVRSSTNRRRMASSTSSKIFRIGLKSRTPITVSAKYTATPIQNRPLAPRFRGSGGGWPAERLDRHRTAGVERDERREPKAVPVTEATEAEGSILAFGRAAETEVDGIRVQVRERSHAEPVGRPGRHDEGVAVLRASGLQRG